MATVTSIRPLRVVMAPDWRRHNPYLNLLAGSLRDQGVMVSFATARHRILPLYRLMRQASPSSILHLHWYEAYVRRHTTPGQFLDGLQLLIDLALVKWNGNAIVWTLHNEIPHNTNWPAWHRFLRGGMAAFADRIITHSPVATTLVSSDGHSGQPKLSVIPHPHYRDYYGDPVERDEARDRLSIPTGKTVFLFFGLIQPYKGLEDLLEAWRSLAGQLDQAYLVVVGEPQLNSFRDRILECSRGLANVNLRLTFARDEDVRYYFSAADYAVYPFRQILTSGSLMLALSYGTPIVAPRIPSTQAQIGAAPALLFTQSSVRSLAETLLAALNAPRRNASSNHDSALCDWNRAAAMTRAIYEQAATVTSPVPDRKPLDEAPQP